MSIHSRMFVRGWRATAFSLSRRARPRGRMARAQTLLVPARSLSRAAVRRPAGKRRASSHSRVGRRLEAAWSHRLDEIAAELAEHFERGNEPGRAIRYHQRAAAKALRRSANGEAIRHLRRALDAIGHVADDVDRIRSRSNCASRWEPPSSRRGDSARRKCWTLTHGRRRFAIVWVSAPISFPRSGANGCSAPAAARRPKGRLGARLLALAETFDDTGLKIQAHHAMWSTSFVCGELAQARAHADGPWRFSSRDASVHGLELRQS